MVGTSLAAGKEKLGRLSRIMIVMIMEMECAKQMLENPPPNKREACQ
jgi:hypothetical protein